MTKLDKPMRREVQIGDQVYTLTIGPDGLQARREGPAQGHGTGVDSAGQR